MILTIMF